MIRNAVRNPQPLRRARGLQLKMVSFGYPIPVRNFRKFWKIRFRIFGISGNSGIFPNFRNLELQEFSHVPVRNFRNCLSLPPQPGSSDPILRSSLHRRFRQYCSSRLPGVPCPASVLPCLCADALRCLRPLDPRPPRPPVSISTRFATRIVLDEFVISMCSGLSTAYGRDFGQGCFGALWESHGN